MRVLLALALVLPTALTVAACPRAGTDPKATTATAAPSPPHWMSVTDGKIHDGLEEAPIGLYVAGEMEAGVFRPGGDIEGQGAFDQPGAPAFLELNTGRLMTEKPAPPYLEGTRAADGSFVPRSRKIVY